MKKLVSILLALALILALSTSAFAAENTSLTINGGSGRTYNGYKLLNLTTSLKDGEHPGGCNGTNHVDSCYNYAYTVNPKYLTVLQAEVFEKAEWTTENPQPATADKVTDDQILKYLTNKTSDNGPAYGSLREVADRLYRAIKVAGIAADVEGLDGVADTIGQGYWMIADVTNLTGNEANSLVMVDTAGQESLTITPKTGLPTIEKKVKDINDSEDSSIDDNAWQDSADHDINDTVPFKLTATLPANLAGYNSYMISFHDTLSAGLTLLPDTIQVTMYASKDDADAAANGTNVTDKFTRPTEAASTFTVSCDNIKAINGVTKDTVFVVTYNATLNNQAVIGAAGNPNEVYLEFSNNPYGTGTGKTQTDKVIVFTYQVSINKIDGETDAALKGAGFKLYKKDAQGNYKLIGDELKGENMTTFEWKGLDDGDYKLEESTVPDGYNKMADIEFTISAVHVEEAANPTLTSLTSPNFTNHADNKGILTRNIENNTGSVLPETGAEGTFFLITGGTLLVLLAAVFMITRKKMSIYED